MAIKIIKVGSGITEGYEVWTDEPLEKVAFSEKVGAVRQYAEDMLQQSSATGKIMRCGESASSRQQQKAVKRGAV